MSLKLEKEEASKESSNGSIHSPDVTSKAVACAEDLDDSSVINAQLPDEVASTPLPTECIINGGSNSIEVDENGENDIISNGKEDDRNDGSRDISEKLSAAHVNVNAKEDLVKQHAIVAEEAIAGSTTNAVNNKYILLLLSVIFETITNYALLLDYHSIFSRICVDVVWCVSTTCSASDS